MPKTPVAVAIVVYKAWVKLPPAQRRQVIAVARKHGPMVAAQVRRHGPSLVRVAAVTARRDRPRGE